MFFLTTVFHTLGKINRIRLHFKKSRTGYHIFGRILENCGPAETIFGQKSGPAMAGPAGPPTTALHIDHRIVMFNSIKDNISDIGEIAVKTLLNPSHAHSEIIRGAVFQYIKDTEYMSRI